MLNTGIKTSDIKEDWIVDTRFPEYIAQRPHTPCRHNSQRQRQTSIQVFATPISLPGFRGLILVALILDDHHESPAMLRGDSD